MSISDQIRRLQNAKAAIKQSLSNKGVIVSDTAKLDEYPALIDSIQAGGGDTYYEDLFYTRINRDGSPNENYSYLFATCSAKELNLSRLDTSNVAIMSNMFYNCSSLTSLDLSNFDTSKVNNMNYMFSNCYNLTSLDVSNFDTGNVTSMTYMFSYCNKLTTLDVSNFDTSNVSNMNNMFGNCSSLTTLDLSNWNTSNITSMSQMFSYCNNLTSINLSSFDTSKVTSMTYMFTNCNNLTSLDLSNWTVHGANTNRMLYNCSSLAKLKLCNCDEETIRNIVESTDFPIGEIEGETRKLYVDEDLIDIVPLPEGWEYKTMYPLYEEGQFERDRNLIVAETRVDSSHTDLSNMFLQCSKLESVDTEDWDTSNVTNMNKMFQYCSALVTLDLSSFNTSKVTEMRQMFDNCNSLETLDLSNWDTSNVDNMSQMFGTTLRKLTTLRMLNCSFDTVNDIVSLFSATAPACTLYINLSEEEAEALDMPVKWNYEII